MHWIRLVCTLKTYTKTVVTITKLYSGNKNGNKGVFKLIIAIKAGWLQTYFCSKSMNIIVWKWKNKNGEKSPGNSS